MKSSFVTMRRNFAIIGCLSDFDGRRCPIEMSSLKLYRCQLQHQQLISMFVDSFIYFQLDLEITLPVQDYHFNYKFLRAQIQKESRDLTDSTLTWLSSSILKSLILASTISLTIMSSSVLMVLCINGTRLSIDLLLLESIVFSKFVSGFASSTGLRTVELLFTLSNSSIKVLTISNCVSPWNRVRALLQNFEQFLLFRTVEFAKSLIAELSIRISFPTRFVTLDINWGIVVD